MTRSKTKRRMGSIEDLILPVVLLLTGLILIGGDHVGVLSLDRIQNLWPMALIIVGLSDFLANEEPAPSRLGHTHASEGKRRA